MIPAERCAARLPYSISPTASPPKREIRKTKIVPSTTPIRHPVKSKTSKSEFAARQNNSAHGVMIR
eukprot:1802729-Prymnesium_polylepis.1